MGQIMMGLVVLLIYSIIGISTGVAILTVSTHNKRIKLIDVWVAVFWGALWPVTLTAVLLIKLFCRFR